MEYTVQKLAKLAGITARALRYYDEIELLKPARVNSSGYRIYGAKEVDRLQQILFYRALDVPLDQIKAILDAENFDSLHALKSHREILLQKKLHLEQLIENVNKSIAFSEGSTHMSDSDKFKGFKEFLVEENEQKYGNEIRQKYGDKAIDDSNYKVLNMSAEDYAKVTNLNDAFTNALKEAFAIGDAHSEVAQKAADLHRQWLCFYWPDNAYTKEAHYAIAQMYVEDERFKAYYDKLGAGTAEFLNAIIKVYTGM